VVKGRGKMTENKGARSGAELAAQGIKWSPAARMPCSKSVCGRFSTVMIAEAR
jgi:hypothetical protein